MNPPLLRVSRLSDPPRVYLITRYSVIAGGDRPPHINASQKHDVTQEFLAALDDWRKATRSAKHRWIKASARGSARHRPTVPTESPDVGSPQPTTERS